MAALDFGTLDLYAGVTEDFPFTAQLFESNGTTAAELGAGDVVVCVLSTRDLPSGRNSDEPTADLLTIQSDQATDNDSKVFITDLGDAATGAPVVGYVRFAQDDTEALVAAWAAGIVKKTLVGELYYIDDSESNPTDARKLFLRGQITLHRTAALT